MACKVFMQGSLMALLVLSLAGCSLSDDPEARTPVGQEDASGQVVPAVGSDCSWEKGSPSAISRLESQVVLWQNKIYTFSGFTGGLIISPETEILNLSSGLWSKGTPMPVGVTHMGAALVGDKVWIAGGFVGNHPGEATDMVQVYDLQTDTWQGAPQLPSPRASGALVCLDDLLYYFGGLQPDRQTDIGEVWVIDPSKAGSSWERRADMPEPRNHHGGVVLDNMIYAVGGQSGHDKTVDDLPFVHAYDPRSDSWERRADLPTDRSHFEPGIFALGKTILLAGGRTDDTYAGDVLKYDAASDTWEVLCELPEALLAPVSRAAGGRLYLLNGGVNGVCCPVDALWYTSLSEN